MKPQFYTKQKVDSLLAGKQARLTAGANITIGEDGTISSTGSGVAPESIGISNVTGLSDKLKSLSDGKLDNRGTTTLSGETAPNGEPLEAKLAIDNTDGGGGRIDLSSGTQGMGASVVLDSTGIGSGSGKIEIVSRDAYGESYIRLNGEDVATKADLTSKLDKTDKAADSAQLGGVDANQYVKKEDLVESSLIVIDEENEETATSKTKRVTYAVNIDVLHDLADLEIEDADFNEGFQKIVGSIPREIEFAHVNGFAELSFVYGWADGGGETMTASFGARIGGDISVSYDGVTVSIQEADAGCVYTKTGGIENFSGWAFGGNGVGYKGGNSIGYYSYNCSIPGGGTKNETLTRIAGVELTPAYSQWIVFAAGKPSPAFAVTYDKGKGEWTFIRQGVPMESAAGSEDDLSVDFGHGVYATRSLVGYRLGTAEDAPILVPVTEKGAKTYELPELIKTTLFAEAAFKQAVADEASEIVHPRLKNDTDTVRIDGEGNVYALEVPKSMYFIVDTGWGGGTDLQEWTLYSSGNGVWKWSNNGAYSSNSYYITYDAAAGTLSAYYASGGYNRTITVEKNLDPTAEGVDFGGLGGLTVAQYSCSYVPKTNQRSEPSEPTDRLARESQLDGKLDSSAAAVPFDSTQAYKVGDYVSHEGRVYRCVAEHAAGAWDAEHFEEECLTSPDANLVIDDETGELKVVGADGKTVWSSRAAAEYALVAESSSEPAADSVQYLELTDSSTTLTIPAVADGKACDFIVDVHATADCTLDIGNLANVTVMVSEGLSLATDVTTFAEGEYARLTFTGCAFRVGGKPTYHVTKTVLVEGVPS